MGAGRIGPHPATDPGKAAIAPGGDGADQTP
jgi:hypothetical protein